MYVPRMSAFRGKADTGTLSDLIDRPLPRPLKLLHGLQRGLPVLGDLGRDILLKFVLGHRKGR